MTVVVFGIDALDPEIVSSSDYPNLSLNSYKRIDTIISEAGEPSTHELWPTIITGLAPEDHGLKLNEGVAWENPLLRWGSDIADYLLPAELQTRLGAWLLNRTKADAFRTPATYYSENGLQTVFDGREATTIGIPNYVVNPNDEDREHQLRRSMGELFERAPEAQGGHVSANPAEFYEQCMEMVMVRTARIRRALRSRQYELVFGYTSGLDLIGHVAYDLPELQRNAYSETDEFVGEVRGDLESDDTLVLISDHGLQDGLHTDEAMIASTDASLVEEVDSVRDVRAVIDRELDENYHMPEQQEIDTDQRQSDDVREDRKSVV